MKLTRNSSESAQSLARHYWKAGKKNLQYAANALAACIKNKDQRNADYYLSFLQENDPSLIIL